MDQPDFPRYVFGSLRQRNKLLLALVSAFPVVISYFVSTFEFVQKILPDQIKDFIATNPKVGAPALNLIVISVLMLWLGKTPLDDEDNYPEATRAVRRFFNSWVGVWISWFCFYGYLLYEELALVVWKQLDHPLIWSAAQNAFNNLQTGFMLLCYFLLSWPIAAAVKNQKFRIRIILIPMFSIVAFLAIIEWMSSSLASGMYLNVAKYFEVASAFSGGVAICLVASRLGTNFVGRVTFAIAVVYLYALIQPGYSIFRIHPELKTPILTIALVLKIWLYLLVRYLMTRGHLLFYFDESIKLNAVIEHDRKEFKPNLS